MLSQIRPSLAPVHVAGGTPMSESAYEDTAKVRDQYVG